MATCPSSDLSCMRNAPAEPQGNNCLLAWPFLINDAALKAPAVKYQSLGFRGMVFAV